MTHVVCSWNMHGNAAQKRKAENVLISCVSIFQFYRATELTLQLLLFVFRVNALGNISTERSFGEPRFSFHMSKLKYNKGGSVESYYGNHWIMGKKIITKKMYSSHHTLEMCENLSPGSVFWPTPVQVN